MVTCHDVAKYILEKQGPMTAMKLQKLVYYAQAWSLVWGEETPLFNENIEAWVNGPVVPELYKSHSGMFKVDAQTIPKGNSSVLNNDQKDTINRILKYYGSKDSQWLSDLTHLEDPWKNARHGLLPNERGGQVISLQSMSEYYSSIQPEN
ncbi:MAG: hypothetical protein K0R52_1523 [Alphaproteobacteria bacterium]|jgi:uncharacterized phage-associated protein|nr:hypothetical protein [Alphaproteobacteria bacterium]